MLLILMAMVLSFVELRWARGRMVEVRSIGHRLAAGYDLVRILIGVAGRDVMDTALVTDPLGAFMNIMATVSLILWWGPCAVGNRARCTPC
ncbi:MAG: hypothetical protein ACLT98_09655 [Eggerthellaceae bacterium]